MGVEHEEERSRAAAESADPAGALVLTALGVVFGDIGTSPLYAFRECFTGPHGAAPRPENILGVLSLIFWALILLVSLKYITLILRADRHGEGGVLALMAQAVQGSGASSPRRFWLIGLGVFGAALLYGDSMITPAISVLSAIEGLRVVTPRLDPYVVPLACALLVALFFIQRRGTGGVGRAFGPVALAWFAVLALLGLRAILERPDVLWALRPDFGLRLLASDGRTAVAVLGAVFLAVTGAEALYADLGHFGLRPIRRAWFGLVLPALLLNYFGQGAQALAHPAALHHPFYALAPAGLVLPLVGLAAGATIIASQAVISGAFSLTRQARQLGYLPRLEVRHTSAGQIGQVYLPWVNRGLLLATLALVLGFGTSSALAGAYGVAISATMAITTLLAAFCARRRFGWRVAWVVPLALLFGGVDLGFLGANLAKIAQGGWFPLAVASLAFVVMASWKRGRSRLAARLAQDRVPFQRFYEDLLQHPLPSVPGTAVFLDSNSEGIPRTLLHNIKHNRVIHELVIFLHIQVEEVSRVPTAQRLRIHELAPGFLRLTGCYGFMQVPQVPELLEEARSRGFALDPMTTTFFLGRETLVRPRSHGLGRLATEIFAFLSRNSESAVEHLGIPPNRVIEIGIQVAL